MQVSEQRREILRKLGFLSLGTTMGGFAWGKPVDHTLHLRPVAPSKPKLQKKITGIVLGAGNRGNVYGNYAVDYPDQLDIVGVAEPIEIRNDRFAKKHNILDNHRFVTWEHVFDQPKFADTIIITTPDDLHHGPAMAALATGYDLLLEKPIAQTWLECKEILDLAEKEGRIVAVCHVLRYSPYYRKVKAVIESHLMGFMAERSRHERRVERILL
ncbi:MAG: Gfo/Idh/MocA family oxidoreductase [Bacteroidota bacterium]